MKHEPAYAVSLISPPGYPHGEALREVARTLHHGMVRAGRDCVLADNLSAPERRQIVLGAHLLPESVSLPDDAVVFNLEQVSADSPWFDAAYLERLRRHTVWDYSERNVVALAGMGIGRVSLVPLGGEPADLPEATEETVDVAFFGSLNARRMHILEGLRERGLSVEAHFGVYGEARDSLAMRAGIVLNVHFYEARVFEIVRVSHMLTLGRFVVSEYGADLDAEGEFAAGVAFAEYEDMIEMCVHYAARPAERRRIADMGRALMRSRDQAAYLMRPLEILEGSLSTTS